ncbi:MAG: Glu-tRNA(Gln) amidotransferase subunit GatD [Promethearchaeota archaeon]
MTMTLEGYKGEALKILEKAGAKIWDILAITTPTGSYEGILLPRNKFAPPDYVEIKLDNGYNVGLKVQDGMEVAIKGNREAHYKIPEKKFPTRKGKPDVVILGTGGTIASRLDYITGGVTPAFTPGELFSAVPELADICNVQTEIVFEIFSEDMKPKYWGQLAKMVEKKAPDVDGFVIGHGTDTMSYTSAALAFMLDDLNVPVVLVGSQRSSDRPSSDAALNLINAVTVASKAPFAEVVLTMLGTTSHAAGYIHRGTLVRKMHSSVRHTFRTIGDVPLGKVESGKVELFQDDYRRRGDSRPVARPNFEEKVGLVYSYPGMDADLVEHFIDKGYKGLVLAGTGLGHFPHDTFEALKRANEEGMVLGMTVQTLWGYTGMDVYETGREEQALGIIPCQNMLPEVAYVKLGWLLGNYSVEEAKKLLPVNLKGEILDGEPRKGYLVLQGIEDGVDDFLKKM